MATTQGKTTTATKAAAGKTVVKEAPAKKAAAKKTPAKMPARKTAAKDPGAAAEKKPGQVAKVSPLKGTPVDAFISKRISGWQAEAARRLVVLVARVAPASTVSIKWSQPVFEENGPMAYIKPAKAHLSFGFWRGAELTDEKKLLTSGDRMGHVKLTSLEALDEAALEPLIRQAARLNREKGNPAKRR